MKALLHLVFLYSLCALLPAQQQQATNAMPEQAPLPVFMVEMDFEDISFFIQTPATSVINLPQEPAYPTVRLLDGGVFRLLDYTVVPATGSTGPKMQIRWYPLEEGLEIFPAIEIVTDAAVYRTSPSQVLVKAPSKSENISLEFRIEKTTVYAGEPLRIDVIWTSSVSAKRLRSLECYPSFLSNPAIEVSTPRTTDPESTQLGLPFGGRRVIARRDVDENHPQALGTVRFPIFVRFPDEGTVIIESTRLQCAQLHQDGGPLAPYAAYYNNGLFEGVETGVGYDLIYTDSEPVEIEVLPLPQEGRTEAFSGLFMPCEITAAITPEEGNVGGLMELEIAVASPVSSDFIELPSLRMQTGLRSWFKVDPEYTRTWQPEGINFSTRIRPLTTKVRTIPSLKFQVFDPESGDYRHIETPPMPITIRPQDGKDYFDTSELLDSTSSLTTQEEGIWNNREQTNMHDVLEFILILSSNYFWVLLALGPVVFLIALPSVREARRRELNPVYREQRRAYREFLKYPEGDARKWLALKKLLAVSLQAGPNAWTIGDSIEKLPEAGVDEATIEIITKCHQIADAEDFSETGKPSALPELRTAGQTCFNILRKSSLLVMVVFLVLASDLRGQDWETTAAQFDAALLLEPGSNEYFAAFSKTALQFESLAESGNRPGMAWYNAGNAWFFSGEIGRSIACYKQALVYRPFDSLVRENLKASRALAIDIVEPKDRPIWLNWPVRWVGLGILMLATIFWLLLLVHVRYRTRPLLTATSVFAAMTACLMLLALYNSVGRNQEGVVIVSEVFARKGPGYTYHTAFHEPLHDGLEFELVSIRNDWMQILLSDGRSCWIPRQQAKLISWSL